MIRRKFITASRITAALFMLTVAVFAESKPASNQAAAIVVDQGSFGIFQNGQRVATENFNIRQYPNSSITSSELRSEGTQSTGKLQQSSELTLLPNGSLSRYEWRQLTPVRSTATVEPSNEFLTMHSVTDGKASDLPFFLTPSAFILDDYFFSTREVLLWRYLASTDCKPRSSGDGCDLTKQRFAIIIPRRRISSEVFIELKGYEDTPVNGRPERLRHFVMHTDGPDWHLWLDSNHKLLRISIPDTHTEILRQEK